MSNKYIRNISLKLRLYPTKEQEIYFNKCFGCARFVYNYYLNERNNFYEKNIKDIKDKSERNKIYKTFKEIPIKELKRIYHWLNEVETQAIDNARYNVQKSFNNFFLKRAEFPKFHSKKSTNTFTSRQPSQTLLDWNNHTVKIPKIGKVRFRNSKVPKWYKNRTKVCSITVSKTPSQKYYISILFEVQFNQIEKKIDLDKMIGLDFDCDDCYIDSNGKSALKDFGFKKQKQENNKKLSHLQRQLVRKHKGSKNYEKARIKLARMEEHIANCRRDWIEKESLRLVKEYTLIGIEDLSIQGMIKSSKNAKNYQDIAWSTFVNKLEWKSSFHNCHVIKVNKFFASSQTCSCCGYKNKDVATKHLEVWKCPKCRQIHQRDINAAINIKNEALKVLREPEESEEKGNSLSKDTHSLLSVSKLANLALEYSRLGNAGNKESHIN